MTNDSFAAPINDRYLEDYIQGSVHTFGPAQVFQEEILSFAERFDPQTFHTDPGAASKSVYGGLIASGWHTSAIMMRLFVDHYLSHNASLGSPGVDELRWVRPVRPGDRLWVRIRVEESRRSRSKPDRGVLRSFVEVVNQADEIVMHLMAVNLVKCRCGVGPQAE
jgi:acyl dehydratase